MLIELTDSPADQELSAFDVQGFFASSQSKCRLSNHVDHEYECPFCYFKVQIILSQSLLVGDSAQLDYSRTKDLLAQHANANCKTNGSQGSLMLGATEREDSVAEEEVRPQVLYTKFQRLKNTHTLARVLIIDEMPVQLSPKDAYQSTVRGTTQAQTNATRMSTEGTLPDNEAANSMNNSQLQMQMSRPQTNGSR